MPAPFRVGLTRDFLSPTGEMLFGDIGLAMLDEAGISCEFMAEFLPEATPEQIAPYDAVIVLAPRFTRRTLAGAERLVLAARFGVGYDNMDVEALTEADVALTITPSGVRRPMAVANLTLVFACAHRLLQKDRLTRAGRWAEKLAYMGTGLRGRTLGSVGLGNIGAELMRLARPFELRLLAHDPYVSPALAADLGVTLVDLDTLCRESDFLTINCALTPETHHLIDARRLALMKPTAYLINAARGGIVDQAALTTALRERRIAGAAVDVFEVEPVPPDDPLLQLDNVIVTPHAIAWTDETFLGNGRACCEKILAVARGQVPENVVNREVLDRPGFQAKLQRYR